MVRRLFPPVDYAGRLGARRQIKYLLNTARARDRLGALCHEAVEAVPHGDTVDDYLVATAPAAVEAIPQAMVRALLEARRLEPFRLLGKYYLATVDLSGHLYLGDTPSAFTEGCLTRTTEDGRTLHYRPVCEAKLITRTGLALSIGSEFVENPPDLNPDTDAQDSELPAARRLFPRLKRAFGGFAFCALLDARYCNETGFVLCQENDWRFIITLKEGSLPSVWKEFQALRGLVPQNRRRVITRRETTASSGRPTSTSPSRRVNHWPRKEDDTAGKPRTKAFARRSMGDSRWSTPTPNGLCRPRTSTCSCRLHTS